VKINRDATGTAGRVAWACLLREPPSIDLGEVTDKGSINQRAVMQCRAAKIEALYRAEDPDLIVAG
jgi:feruloyl-CoA synthase